MADPLHILAPTGFPDPPVLVGRAAAHLRITGAVQRDRCAVIAGVGGIGKSALAATITKALVDDRAEWPGGALWIACDHISPDADGYAELWAVIARMLFLEGIAVEADSVRAAFQLRYLLAQRPRMLLVLDHLAAHADIAAILATLAIPGHTAVIATMVRPPASDAAEVVILERLETAAARELIARATPPPVGATTRARGIPLALHWLARSLVAHPRELASVRRPPDVLRAVHATFSSAIWEILPPEDHTRLAGLAVLAAGSSFPASAPLALGATEEAVTRWLGLGIFQPTGDRLLCTPTTRALLARHWRDLDAATCDQLGALAIAFWLAEARRQPGFTGTTAIESDAAGLYGILAYAVECQDPAARALAHELDYALG